MRNLCLCRSVSVIKLRSVPDGYWESPSAIHSDEIFTDSQSTVTACWWAFNDKLREAGRVAEAPLSQSRTGNREKASAVRLIQAIGLRWQRARQVTRQVRDHYLEADSRSSPNCRFHARVINWGFKGSCFTSAVPSVWLVYLCKAKMLFAMFAQYVYIHMYYYT